MNYQSGFDFIRIVFYICRNNSIFVEMSLSKAEEQLMHFLWSLKRAFMKDLIEAYPIPKPKASTVATLLKRMQDKGYVAYEKHGSVRQYYAKVSKSDYFQGHFDEMIDNYFDSSTAQFASFFTAQSDLTKDQLLELKAIIDAQIAKKRKDELPD